MGGLRISKEPTSLSEEVHKVVKKTFYVKYYFKYFHNPQASKGTRKLTTSQYFMSSFMA